MNETKRPNIAIIGGGRNAGRTLKAHIELLEELETYRAIGTIDEFKALKNKHIGKDNMVISSSDLMTILNSDSEELKQYKEVGTVEECRVAVERMKPKKVKDRIDDYGDYFGRCPVCDRGVVSQFGTPYQYCPKCGIKLDWSE